MDTATPSSQRAPSYWNPPAAARMSMSRSAETVCHTAGTLLELLWDVKHHRRCSWGCTNSIRAAPGVVARRGARSSRVRGSVGVPRWRVPVLVSWCMSSPAGCSRSSCCSCAAPGSKELEIVVLRHELSILRRQERRPRLSPHDRVVLAALSRVLPRLVACVSRYTGTLLRGHRRMIARRWTYPHRRPGRPAARSARARADPEARARERRLGLHAYHRELRALGVTVPATLVPNVR